MFYFWNFISVLKIIKGDKAKTPVGFFAISGKPDGINFAVHAEVIVYGRDIDALGEAPHKDLSSTDWVVH